MLGSQQTAATCGFMIQPSFLASQPAHGLLPRPGSHSGGATGSGLGQPHLGSQMPSFSQVCSQL